MIIVVGITECHVQEVITFEFEMFMIFCVRYTKFASSRFGHTKDLGEEKFKMNLERKGANLKLY